MRRTLLTLTAALAASGATPAAASAATLALDGDTYVLTGDPGRNQFSTRADDNGLLQIHGGNLGANLPAGCSQDAWDNDAHCALTAGGLRIDAGAGNDEILIELTTPPAMRVTALGGDGDDVLKGYDGDSTLDGGTGNDQVSGGRGADIVLGGEGDDLVVGDGYVTASPDVIDGGPGLDTSQGDWTDTTVSSATPPVAVSLDGVADDGRAGEGDNVTGLERIKMNSAATLIAGPGPVDFEIPSNAGTVKVKLVGSASPDRLKAAHGHDEVDGGGGDDDLEGGYGNDTITGGAGRDTINADASGGCDFVVCNAPVGNDTILARDGEADSIDCGVGTDRAVVDAVDTLSNCETVESSGGTPPGGTPPGGGSTPPGGGNDGRPAPGSRPCKVPKVKARAKLSSTRATLRAAGCKVRVVKVTSKSVPKDRVVRLSHRRGKTVAAGKSVTVYVSKGRR